jgi:hypothetical protein
VSQQNREWVHTIEATNSHIDSAPVQTSQALGKRISQACAQQESWTRLLQAFLVLCPANALMAPTSRQCQNAAGEAPESHDPLLPRHLHMQGEFLDAYKAELRLLDTPFKLYSSEPKYCRQQ